jgi:signal transduction histidine kinase
VARNAGIVLDHATIYDRIWGYDFGPDSKNLAVYISYLRRAEDVGSSGRLDVAVPGTGTDEVGRLGSAFRDMLGALALSRAEQHRLVQDAGHELRTPLTSLTTNLSVLRRHPNMGPEMRNGILDDLETEVGELTALVNELVAVASGELDEQPNERLDLPAMAVEIAERVGRRRSRDVVVQVEHPATVDAPRAALERAVTNLIDNACKFDQSGFDDRGARRRGIAHRARPRSRHRVGRGGAHLRSVPSFGVGAVDARIGSGAVDRARRGDAGPGNRRCGTS